MARTASRSLARSLSAATFVPRLPTERQGTSAVVRRTVANSLLQQSYDQLLKTEYLRVDPKDNSELWRISLRVAAFQDVDYGRFADEVRSLVVPLMEHHSKSWPKGQAPMVSAIFTGVVPIVYKAQRALLESLVQSAVWSFLTITPLLMFVCRSIGGGLVAMIPNVLPILVVFGGMAWLDWPVSIGSMMAASIALGVAVDDTIHYLTWFREDLAKNCDRNTAILVAYRRCGTPTLQAALINGLGLSVFAVSTFTPTREFGLLMLAILLAGGVAELVMMPALLAGPLGAVFEPRPVPRGIVRGRFAWCAAHVGPPAGPQRRELTILGRFRGSRLARPTRHPINSSRGTHNVPSVARRSPDQLPGPGSIG